MHFTVYLTVKLHRRFNCNFTFIYNNLTVYVNTWKHCWFFTPGCAICFIRIFANEQCKLLYRRTFNQTQLKVIICLSLLYKSNCTKLFQTLLKTTFVIKFGVVNFVFQSLRAKFAIWDLMRKQRYDWWRRRCNGQDGGVTGGVVEWLMMWWSDWWCGGETGVVVEWLVEWCNDWWCGRVTGIVVEWLALWWSDWWGGSVTESMVPSLADRCSFSGVRLIGFEG